MVVKNGKFLITQRSEDKSRFPEMWTVPGGKLETDDYINLEKDTEHHWYNILEKVIEREVKEEVNLDIEHVEYVTSLAMVHEDGAPSLIISVMADYAGGDIELEPSETVDHAWVSVEEAKDYDLIDGIYDELVMADKQLSGEASKWSRANT